MIRAVIFDALGVLYVHGKLDKNLAAFLREKGDQFKFVLCTASGQSMLEALRADGILEHFDLLVTAENNPKQKNDPTLYTEIAETLQIEPEQMLFLDDTIAFVRAARKAGIRAIHYTDPESFVLDHTHEH